MKFRVSLMLVLVLALAACDGRNGGDGGDGGDGGNGGDGGSGEVITEEREVSDFDQVLLAGSGTVQIIQGDSESLVIEAEDSVMPLIESTVENGVLTLSQRSNLSISLTRPIKYTVTMIDISGLEITGSGDMNSERVDANIISFVVTGSGGINIDELDADSIDARISGSGDVTLVGDVADQVVEISGSGAYQAADLRSGTAVVTVGGSGNASVWVDTTLDITVSGSGDVSYYGDPILTQSVSGSGQVRSLGAK